MKSEVKIDSTCSRQVGRAKGRAKGSRGKSKGVKEQRGQVLTVELTSSRMAELLSYDFEEMAGL